MTLRNTSRYCAHMASTEPPATWVELRVIREKDGHSLSSLSRASGVALGHLSDLENGKREPTAAVTKKLARALNVPVSVLEKHRRDAA